MGVTNFDNLVENQAVSTLREAAQVMHERKAMQLAGGSSIRYFRTDSPGAWLWSGQLDTVSAQSSGTGLARFLLVFTSTVNIAFMSSCVVEAEGSSDGLVWTPLPSSPGPSTANWKLQDAGVINGEPYKAKYDLSLQGPVNEYRRFKVQALTSDPVSISAVRTL